METLCMLKGGVGGTSLKSMGFINVPSGSWEYKVGDLSITSKNENIIPICAYISCYGRRDWENNTSYGGNISSSTNINSKQAINGYSSFSWGFDNGWNRLDSGTNYTYVFLPVFYGLDLSATQNGFTSGTLKAWLEKK